MSTKGVVKKFLVEYQNNKRVIHEEIKVLLYFCLVFFWVIGFLVVCDDVC